MDVDLICLTEVHRLTRKIGSCRPLTVPTTCNLESNQMAAFEVPRRPAYDPLLVSVMEASKDMFPEKLDVPFARAMGEQLDFGPKQVIDALPHLKHSEYSAPGLEADDGDVLLSVFSPIAPTSTSLPAVYFIHGGGQVSGDRFAALSVVMEWFESIDITFVSVEYHLAPEHRAPAALHDSYAGLLWLVAHAEDLGVDTSKIIICGGSGGAPIAAGTSMLCTRHAKPFPLAQMILTPMLDDRDCTVSSKQFARDGPWCGTTNRMAWDCVLGDSRGSAGVDELVAPGRATDLVGMPPTFVDAGACEVFRDEAVAFASNLWKSGVNAELHVWPGAFHGFDMLGFATSLAQASRNAKKNWIRRVLTVS